MGRVYCFMPWLGAILLSAVSCAQSTPDASGCRNITECPAAHVCDNGSCFQLCESDNQCLASQHCDGDICVAGGRAGGKPILQALSSNSTHMCGDAPCIGSLLKVTGTNLAGAQFTLTRKDTRQVIGVEITTSSATQVSLAFADPASVLPGTYMLSAVNQAGGADGDLEITLLRGEPGPKGDKGDPGEQGPPGASGSGAQLYYYKDNLPVQTSEINGGRAYYSVAASNPSGMTIPAGAGSRIAELCGDADGCMVSLGITNWDGTAGAAPIVGGIYWGPECRMFYNPSTGGWSVSQFCGAGYFSSATENLNYGSYWSGIDGDSFGVTILSLNQACYFGEAPPDLVNNNSLMQIDSADAMSLFANNGTWNPDGYPSGFWNPAAAGTRCELSIKD